MVFYGGFENPCYFTKVLNSMVFYRSPKTHGILKPTVFYESFETHEILRKFRDL